MSILLKSSLYNTRELKTERQRQRQVKQKPCVHVDNISIFFFKSVENEDFNHPINISSNLYLKPSKCREMTIFGLRFIERQSETQRRMRHKEAPRYPSQGPGL